MASEHQGTRLALWLMVTAQFMVVLDSSIINVALPTIQRSLHFSPVGVEGVVTAYATAFGGALLLGGRLADRLGRRRVFTGGLAAFSAASLACAAAPTAAFLVTARALQGLGAAAVAPAALSLLTTTFREGPERNRALGVFGAATALGFVAGQLLGGVLTDLIGWPAIFVINVPVGVAAALLALRTIPPDGAPAGRPFADALGALLATAAAGLAVWAPTQGASHGWSSGAFLLPLAAAVVLLGGFLAIESRHPDPLLRLGLLTSRWMATTNIAAFVTGALNGAVVLLCTLYLQRAHGYSPLDAGLAFLPMGVAGFYAGTRLAGPLITRAGVRIVLAVSLFAAAAAVLGLSQLQGGGAYLPLLPWLVVTGASFVTAAVASTVAVSSGVAASEQGVAAALRQTAFQLGVAIAVAAFLSIAASRTAAALEPAHSIATAATAGQAAAVALQAGYQLALRLCAALAAVGGLVALAGLKRLTHAAPVPEPAEKRLA
jgi:EmrB/QacA subfamily drug resistance transporter